MQNDNLVLHSCELILCLEYTKNRASDSILMLFFICCAKEIGETCEFQNQYCFNLLIIGVCLVKTSYFI